MSKSSAWSPPTPAYGVVVPLKPKSSGKSRLAPLGERVRRELVSAFAADTVVAAQSCTAVQTLLVVTDDVDIAREMVALGIEAIPDGCSDLNGALVQAATELVRRAPHLRPVALCGDLPALRPEEVGAALARTPPKGAAFVADAEGSGTTLYTASDLSEFRPQFGHQSRAAHLAEGARELAAGELAGVHLDVDTPEDLVGAVRLGVGVHTAEVVERLGLAALPRT